MASFSDRFQTIFVCLKKSAYPSAKPPSIILAMHIIISHRYSGRIIRDIIRGFTCTAGTFSNKKSDNDIEIPPEPTTCCMSGCTNCVWIAYAEELSKIYQGNGEKARQIILDKIDDPNLKMFLSIELKYIHTAKAKENE